MALRYLTALACLFITIRILDRMVSGEWLVVSGRKRFLSTRSSVDPRSSMLNSRSSILIIVTLILCGHYLIRDFDDGGPNVILLAILLGGVYCIWQGRDIMGAFWLGLAIAVKITPGLVLPYFLWKGRWRAAAYTTTATLLWIVVPGIWMSVDGAGLLVAASAAME